MKEFQMGDTEVTEAVCGSEPVVNDVPAENVVASAEPKPVERGSSDTKNSEDEIVSLKKQNLDLRRIISDHSVKSFFSDESEESKKMRTLFEERTTPEQREKLLDFCRQNNFSEKAANAFLKRELEIDIQQEKEEQKAVSENKAKAEREAKAKAEQEAEAKAEQEARVKAEQEAEARQKEYYDTLIASPEYAKATVVMDSAFAEVKNGMTETEQKLIEVIYQQPSAKIALYKLFSGSLDGVNLTAGFSSNIPGDMPAQNLETVTEENYQYQSPEKQAAYNFLTLVDGYGTKKQNSAIWQKCLTRLSGRK